jgi:hypothetical protein
MLAPAKPRANLGLRDGLIAEALLRGQTLEHRRHTRPYAVLPNPVEIQPLAGHPVNTHVLHFVQEKERGVILLGNGVGRCAIIAELAKAFPRQSFAVMTANHRQSKDVQYKLGKFDIRCQRITNTPGRDLDGRIVVGMFDSRNDRSVEFEKREVLIAYDAKQTLAERAQQLLVQPDVCGRLFGFIGAGTDVSPLQDDQLAATFGFDQIAVPLHGYCSVRLDAHFMTYNGGGVESNKALQVKREGIWKNKHRTQQVSAVACSLVERNREKLASRLPDFNADDMSGFPWRVVLLADNVEHIAEIALRHRSWPIRLADNYCSAGLTAEQRRLLERGIERSIGERTLIASPDGLAAIPPGSFDAVIWAGSGSGYPPIPWHHLVCPAASPRRLLLIDIRDRHNTLLRSWSTKRRRLYREVGWMDQALCPTLAKALRFLDRKYMEARR